MPSTSKAAQVAAICRSAPSPSRTEGSNSRAATIRRRTAASSSAQRAAKAAGSSSYASRRRTTSTRRSGSREAATSTVSPKRSRSCGRSSPSSGFIVPTSRKRAACRTETPSRSTYEAPIAAASRSRSTRWSWRRLTSSTYRMPRWAPASSPGSKAFTPSARARSMSSAPTSRSSEAPTGSSTMRAARDSKGPGSCGPSGHPGSGRAGSHEKRQPGTTSTAGSSAVSARTAVDLAVPFSPRTRTPPTAGDTAFSSSASRRSSWPTTAVNGKGVLTSRRPPDRLRVPGRWRAAAPASPRPVPPTGPGRPPPGGVP
ncbi:hypothetical protein B0E37_03444 [Streptomyces sp. MH192]|nr:hypothetical protein [Streptomyces sp. MH192]MCF0100623.1 hypothetical protein [Streptomyces sp. MH191]